MKVAVWDTYVQKPGGWQHFDIIVPTTISEEAVVWSYGLEYLQERGFPFSGGTIRKCSFCHIETPDDEMIEAIRERGYFILEMPEVVSVT